VAFEYLSPTIRSKPALARQVPYYDVNERGVVVVIVRETFARGMLQQLGLPSLTATPSSNLARRISQVAAFGIATAIGLAMAVAALTKTDDNPAVRIAFADVPAAPAIAAAVDAPSVQPPPVRQQAPARSASQSVSMHRNAIRPTPGPSFQAFDASPPVASAIKAALTTGTTQPWLTGDLSGYVVAGPTQIDANRTCRTIAVWVRARGAINGSTNASRLCLLNNGNWTRMPSLPGEPSDSDGTVAVPSLSEDQTPETAH
jgi:hypothetical protein